MACMTSNKALRLPPIHMLPPPCPQSPQAISNLQSNDAAKLWGLPTYVHVLWNGPFQVRQRVGVGVRVCAPASC